MAAKSFGGVPIEALNKIADACRRGGFVSVIGDKLYYNYRSARGHQVNHAEFIIRAGKLLKMTAGHYPGQTSFPDIDFMNLANEMFDFKG